MPNLNLVYINLEPADGYALQRGSVRVVWSRFPVEGCDLYAYNSAYSYFGERPGPQVLVHMEPVITQPRAFTTEVWTHFDYALTLIGGLDGVLPQMKAWPVPVYGRGPMPLPAPTYAELRERHPIDGRAHAICMINGAKTSRVPGELYTAREEIARWFGAHSEMPFDVYGQPAFMDLPGYVGSLTREEKPLTLAKYRYSLCFENCYDPFWSRGYITEKLPECIQSRTVPIYLGCWDIEEYFPDGCYIDYRRFDGCADLNDYLVNIPEDEYREYIANIDAWLRAGNLGTFTVSHLYDLLAGLYAEHTGQPLVEIISGDESWTPCDVPPRLARVAGDPGGTVSISATDNIRQYWSWDYLADGDLDECARSLDVIRETQTLLASAPSRTSEKRRKTSREIRKVLYVGVESTHGAHPPEREYNTSNLFAAFAAWPGVSVSHVDPATQAIAWGVAGMSERLYQRVREEAFDLVFTVPFAPVYDVMPETMRDIARCTDTASVVWSSDPFGTYDPRGGGQSDCADHVVTTSDEEYEAFVTAGDGSLAILSRWAYQPTTYMPGSGARKPVVTLVGQRRDLRARICEALLAQGIPVSAHGVGWGSGRYLRFPRFLRTLQESAINLNVGSRRRVYEVTGCGGFLLTTPVEGLEESYVTDEADPANAEVVLAHDIEQLVEKIRYYLAHEEEREAIAARGHRRARAEHTWSYRLAEVFEKTEWTLPGMGN